MFFLSFLSAIPAIIHGSPVIDSELFVRKLCCFVLWFAGISMLSVVFTMLSVAFISSEVDGFAQHVNAVQRRMMLMNVR